MKEKGQHCKSRLRVRRMSSKVTLSAILKLVCDQQVPFISNGGNRISRLRWCNCERQKKNLICFLHRFSQKKSRIKLFFFCCFCKTVENFQKKFCCFWKNGGEKKPAFFGKTVEKKKLIFFLPFTPLYPTKATT